MRKILLFLAVFFLGCSTLSAQVVNPCGAEAVCKPTWECVTKVKKFVSWTEFQTWQNANQGKSYEIEYANSTYPVISYEDSCIKIEKCYDNEGECQ